MRSKRAFLKLFLKCLKNILHILHHLPYYDILMDLLHKHLHFKLIVPLPNGLKVLVRPFSKDLGPAIEIFVDEKYELYERPKPGDLVIDAGAHIGFFTIKASKQVGQKGLVLAFEPHPDNFQLLTINIKLNRLENVIPINVALGDRKRKVKLFIREPRATIGYSLITPSHHYINVQMTTLDEILSKCKNLMRRNIFIKVDVEGAEYLLLKGAKNILTSNNVKLVIETHGDDVKQQCKKYLKKLGYTIKERDAMLYAQKYA